MLEKCNAITVLSVFFTEPLAEHGVREVSRKCGLSPPAVKLWLEKLENWGYIKREGKKYVANRDSEKFLRDKMIFNLWKLYSSGLVNYIAEFAPKAVILFGSYRYGYDTEKSDIDLLIISRAPKKLELGKFERVLGRKINVQFARSLSELDENLLENVLNGIVVYGGLEVSDLGSNKD